MTQDWSNDAENTALITEINYILTYIHTEHSYFKFKYFFTILLFLLYFCSHNRRAGETSFRNIKRLIYCASAKNYCSLVTHNAWMCLCASDKLLEPSKWVQTHWSGDRATLTLSHLNKEDEGLYTLRVITKSSFETHSAYVFVRGEDQYSPSLLRYTLRNKSTQLSLGRYIFKRYMFVSKRSILVP